MKRILTTAVLLGLGSMSLHAAGATAGTSVDNTATLDYDVAAVPQAQIVSNNDNFLVDNKIDFTVVHQDATIVIGDTKNEPDMIFLVEYPSVAHFMKMVSNPDYKKIANDRSIALEYGGLIACLTLK